MNYLRHLETVILPSWMKHTPDRLNGGFHRALDRNWKIQENSPKGLVQHARFVWTFSAAYAHTKNEDYRAVAGHAIDFLITRFKDRTHGGWFYSLDAAGHPLDSRKHIYPHSFVIYALSEYADAFSDKNILNEALDTFRFIDKKAHDPENLGYHESFSSEWEEINQHEDMGITGKRKSMNTHIHLLESFTALARASKKLGPAMNPLLLARMNELVDLCRDKIFNSERNSLDLFFEKDWTALPSPTSYGHDIELSWLLDEAAEFLGRRADTREISLRLANHSLNALVEGGTHGLYYEGDSEGAIHDRRRVWWVQAEGLVGFLNAYVLSRNKEYLDAFESLGIWVTEKQADIERGDWHEEIDGEGNIQGAKAHLWKDPYHQSRACLEVNKRLSKLNPRTFA